MTSLIIGVLLFFISTPPSFSKEGHLSNYWFNGVLEKSFKEDNLQSIDTFLNEYVRSHSNIGLDYHKGVQNHSWYFAGFQTSLALGLKGKIGIHSWGGTKTIEVDWERRNQGQHSYNKLEKLSEDQDLTKSADTLFLDDQATEKTISSRVNFIITKAKKSGRVRNLNLLEKELRRVLKSFLNLGQSLNSYSFNHWQPTKFRLDLGIKSNGKLVFGPLIKTGGGLRIRLEWKKTKFNYGLKMTSSNKPASLFFRKLESILNSSLNLAKKESLYPLSFIEIGLGIGMKGNINIAEIGAYGTPSIFFKKASSFKKLALHNPIEGPISALIHKRNKEKNLNKPKLYLNLDQQRLKRGIKKAFKFSNKFIKKLNKKIDPNSVWRIKKIKTQFQFSLDGSLGPVKISGIPHIAFYVLNNKK